MTAMESMESTSAVQRGRRLFVWTRGWLEAFPLSLLLLALRFGIGGIFFNSGLIKLHSFEFAVKLFEQEYRLPLLDPTIAARLAAFNEITFPLFLFVGLATRFAVLPLIFMTFVIFTIYPTSWAESLLWAAALATLLTRGAGAISVDYLIERWFRRSATM